MENDIVEKIDSFIEACREEIRKEKRKTIDEKNRKEQQYKTDQKSEFLIKYVLVKRFGFNSCVKDCFGKSSVEAYKAIRKRITDPKKKASQEDYKKMEQLYAEMQKRYKNPDSFYQCSALPSNSQLLSKSLRVLMDKISKSLDKQIQNSSNQN